MLFRRDKNPMEEMQEEGEEAGVVYKIGTLIPVCSKKYERKDMQEVWREPMVKEANRQRQKVY